MDSIQYRTNNSFNLIVYFKDFFLVKNSKFYLKKEDQQILYYTLSLKSLFQYPKT